jgi:hypothetical protein
MKNKTQKLYLKLRGKVFSVCPLNKGGRRGNRYDWEIRKNGKLPSALFFHLRNYVTFCSVRRALKCRPETPRHGTRRLHFAHDCRMLCELVFPCPLE